MNMDEMREHGKDLDRRVKKLELDFADQEIIVVNLFQFVASFINWYFNYSGELHKMTDQGSRDVNELLATAQDLVDRQVAYANKN